MLQYMRLCHAGRIRVERSQSSTGVGARLEPRVAAVSRRADAEPVNPMARLDEADSDDDDDLLKDA